MASTSANRGLRTVAVALVSLLALLGAGLVASPANAVNGPCYPATCNPVISVTSPTTTTVGISASINNVRSNTTVTWTWTNGTLTFTETRAVNSAGVSSIVMPVPVAGTWTITAVGYTTDANNNAVQVTRTGTAEVTAPGTPQLSSTLVPVSGKSKAKFTITPSAGATCPGPYRYRLEYKKKKSQHYYKRIPKTYYTGGPNKDVLTIYPISKKHAYWYRAVVAAKCGLKGLITSPLVKLKKK